MTSTPAATAAGPAAIGSGLSREQVDARRHQYGPNEVLEKKPHAILGFLTKFWGLSAWMLEAIAALSWALRRDADLAIAAALLVLNAVIGFVQERRAEGVVDTLRRRLQVNARVLREGHWQALPARELVPDDIIRIRQGDVVPADIRLLNGTVGVDQSVLTGESQDAEKTADATVYSGSVIRRGEATGLVTATGARTYFGRTTELVQIARPVLHAEALVTYLVRWLFVIVGAVVLVIVGLAVARGIPLVDVLPLLLALLLGAVPVALPVMLTVSMAVGARELAAAGVLVTRLSATEDAAAMDVLCVDKTGTITANRLAVARVIPLPGFTEEDVLQDAAHASEAANQDPIDLAILAAARERATTPSGDHGVEFRPVRRRAPPNRSRRAVGWPTHARGQRRSRRRRAGMRAGCRGHRHARREGARAGGSRLPHARRGTRIRFIRARTGRSPLPARSPTRGRAGPHHGATKPERGHQDADRRCAAGRDRSRETSRAWQDCREIEDGRLDSHTRRRARGDRRGRRSR